MFIYQIKLFFLAHAKCEEVLSMERDSSRRDASCLQQQLICGVYRTLRNVYSQNIQPERTCYEDRIVSPSTSRNECPSLAAWKLDELVVLYGDKQVPERGLDVPKPIPWCYIILPCLFPSILFVLAEECEKLLMGCTYIR